MKKLRLPLILIFAVVILNSIVIASPIKPAIVGGTIIEQSQLVRPFTRWESRSRYLIGEKLVLFAAPDEDNIWVLRLTYSVRHIDLLEPAKNWETWLTSRLTSIMNNVYTNVMSTLPLDADPTEYYVAMVSDLALLAELGRVMKTQFNDHHKDVMVMQGITIVVEKITLAEYQASR